MTRITKEDVSDGIDLIRGGMRDWAIRRLYGGAAKGSFADPLKMVCWLPKNHTKAAFIPIGANIPELESRAEASGARNGTAKEVAVFSVGARSRNDTARRWTQKTVLRWRRNDLRSMENRLGRSVMKRADRAIAERVSQFVWMRQCH